MTDTAPRTHLAIDRRLCGDPVTLSDGAAEVTLTTTAEMRADDRNLVHGGFVFGMADYAAMLAVGHPLVVLAAAEVKFTAPVVVGQTLRAIARVTEGNEKRQTVAVEVKRDDDVVFMGTFQCAVPRTHVLDRRS